MKSNNPVISVIMSVYNGGTYLFHAIESILNQTFADFEFIIFDDCSTDNSRSIIESFDDNRIVFVQNETNLRLTKTLNKGLRLAKGKYIARMDADDIALPQRFEKQVAFMEANPDVVVLGTAFKSFGNFEKTTVYEQQHNEIRWKQLYECHMLHPSVMLRNEFLQKNGLCYDESFAQAQDYDFWARISQVGKLANLPEVLMHYRQSDGNISHQYKNSQQQGILRVCKYLFSCLGVKDLSDEEWFMFKETAYHQYKKGATYLAQLESLLNKIWKANQQSCYFPSSFLAAKVYFLWYHACYNNLTSTPSAKTIFFQSPISKLQPDLIGKAKFHIKSVV